MPSFCEELPLSGQFKLHGDLERYKVGVKLVYFYTVHKLQTIVLLIVLLLSQTYSFLVGSQLRLNVQVEKLGR